jgi:hypothetical protein
LAAIHEDPTTLFPVHIVDDEDLLLRSDPRLDCRQHCIDVDVLVLGMGL